MKGIDRDILLASRNLGANPLQTFIRIYFPMSLPGVLGGCLLVFILGLGSYITPALLGGVGDVMIAMLIENNVTQLLNFNSASAISIVLFLSTILIIIVFRFAFGLQEISTGFAGKGGFKKNSRRASKYRKRVYAWTYSVERAISIVTTNIKRNIAIILQGGHTNKEGKLPSRFMLLNFEFKKLIFFIGNYSPTPTEFE